MILDEFLKMIPSLKHCAMRDLLLCSITIVFSRRINSIQNPFNVQSILENSIPFGQLQNVPIFWYFWVDLAGSETWSAKVTSSEPFRRKRKVSQEKKIIVRIKENCLTNVSLKAPLFVCKQEQNCEKWKFRVFGGKLLSDSLLH